MRAASTLLAVAVALAAGVAAPAYAQSADTILSLDPLPSSVSSGTTVVISGWLSDSDGYVVPYATVYVKDDVDLGRDETIAALTTDADGEFYAEWTAVQRPSGGSWDIYAVFEGGDGLQKSRSETYSVTVAEGASAQPSAQRATGLYLEPLPSSAVPGATVVISGWLSDSDGYVVPYATVYVKDDVDLGRDEAIAALTTDADGEFYAEWTAVQRPSGGSWDFYAVFEGGDGLQKSRSETYSVAVAGSPSSQLPTRLELDSFPPSAREGQAVTFSGSLSSGGLPVPGAAVEIKDDDPLLPDDALVSARTGADGRFAVSWFAERGQVENELEVYAEYDGDSEYAPSSTPRYNIAIVDAEMVVVERDPDADEPDGGEGSGGCLIATAAHGTELAPQVQALREYRDGMLLGTGAGSAFMPSFSAAYYAFSPAVADIEREHPAARQAVAALIAPLLYALQVAALADPGSEGSVLAHGIAAALLAAGLYIGAPVAAAAGGGAAARRIVRRRGAARGGRRLLP